jgi:alpha-1,3-mannosyltransferase
MKILHIARQFYPAIGGLENYVLNLASTQIKLGHEVTVVTLNRNFLNFTKLPEQEQLPNGIQVYRIPFYLTRRYPVAPGIYKHLKEHDIVNVHAVDFFADFISLTKPLHNKRTVLVTHGGFFHSRWAYRFKKIFFSFITRFTIRNYNSVVACSDNDIRIFKRIRPDISLVYNGVDIQPYLRTPKKVVPGQLLYVGRLDNHKRIDNLIRVVAELRKQEVEVTLQIVGPDWASIVPELKELSREFNIENHIKFSGTLSNRELADAYAQAHLFVSASEYEGFGLTVVEALSSGTPCVLNNIESFEFLAGNKSFGAVCDFNDTEETALEIARLLRSPSTSYERISDDARQYSKKYDWEKVALQFEEIYGNILPQEQELIPQKVAKTRA